MKKTVTRHDARILALSALFCWELTRLDAGNVLSQLVEDIEPDAVRDPVSRENIGYARELLNYAVSDVSEIDDAISRASRGWHIERMPTLDLCIMRLAAAELRYFPSVPTEVILDEAVELAKEYSTYGSPRFINGVLNGMIKSGYAGRISNSKIR